MFFSSVFFFVILFHRIFNTATMQTTHMHTRACTHVDARLRTHTHTQTHEHTRSTYSHSYTHMAVRYIKSLTWHKPHREIEDCVAQIFMKERCRYVDDQKNMHDTGYMLWRFILSTAQIHIRDEMIRLRLICLEWRVNIKISNTDRGTYVRSLNLNDTNTTVSYNLNLDVFMTG